jgi:hypothetical protein
MDHSGHHEPAQGQAPDNLILDIGADTGALVIHTGTDRDQAEIEISPTGAGQPRTHNVVRARQAPAGVRHAAVFPALRAGGYTVWGDASTPAGTVTVHGGMITEFRLPGAAPRNTAPAAASDG